MLWSLFEISIHVFHGILLVYFFRTRLHVKPINRVADPVFVTLFSLFLFFYWKFFFLTLPIEIIYLLVLPYALIISKDRFYIVGFWVCVSAIAFLSTQDISFYMLSSFPELSAQDILQSQGLDKALYMMVYLLLLFLLFFIISHFKKEYNHLSWPTLFLFLAVGIAFFLAEKLLYTLQSSRTEFFQRPLSTYFFLLYLIFCLSTLGIAALFQKLSSVSELEKQLEEEKSTLELSLKHQSELEQLYDRLSSHRHDFRQHMQVLTEMVSSGNLEPAKKYLESYQEDVNREIGFASGSPAVDALLTAKKLTMEKCGIQFECSLHPLSRIPLSTAQLCSVIGNMLDNAIEGVQRIAHAENPVIQLKMMQLAEMLCIICLNPCNPATIRRSEDRWFTSKRSGEGDGQHAIGLRTIRRLVREAEGHCDFSVASGVFTAKVLLPLLPAGED